MNRPNLVFLVVIAIALGVLVALPRKPAPEQREQKRTPPTFAAKASAAPQEPLNQEPPPPPEDVVAVAEEPGVVFSKPPVAETPISLELRPVGSFKYAGADTVKRAVETFVWASVSQEIETLTGLLAWPSGRDYSGVVARMTRWSSKPPETFLALLHANDAKTMTGVQVLAHEELGPDDQQVRIRFTYDDGAVREELFVMRLGRNGWQRQMDKAEVETLPNRLRSGLPEYRNHESQQRANTGWPVGG